MFDLNKAKSDVLYLIGCLKQTASSEETRNIKDELARIEGQIKMFLEQQKAAEQSLRLYAPKLDQSAAGHYHAGIRGAQSDIQQCQELLTAISQALYRANSLLAAGAANHHGGLDELVASTGRVTKSSSRYELPLNVYTTETINRLDYIRYGIDDQYAIAPPEPQLRRPAPQRTENLYEKVRLGGGFTNSDTPLPQYQSVLPPNYQRLVAVNNYTSSGRYIVGSSSSFQPENGEWGRKPYF